MAEFTLYVLECLESKYYVGRTNNYDVRIKQHYSGEGNEWTRKYKPITTLLTKPYATGFDETSCVLEHMNRLGIENIRGGPYTSMELTPEQVDEIKKRIDESLDKCARCGKAGHLYKTCPETIKEKEDKIAEAKAVEQAKIEQAKIEAAKVEDVK